MSSAARLAAAPFATAWRTGRRHARPPLTALAPSAGARSFSPGRIVTRNQYGTGVAVSTRRVAEMTAAGGGKGKRSSGESIAVRPGPPPPTPCFRAARPATPLHGGPKDRRGVGYSAAGRGSAPFGGDAVAGDTGTGGSGGVSGAGAGAGRRSASTHTKSSGPDGDGDEGGRDFAVAKDGAETYLVAARRLEAGRVVFDRVGGSLSDRPTRHSVQVREGLHLEAEVDLVFLNHSCDPNCRLEVVEPEPEPALGAPAREKDAPYLRVTVRAPEIRRNQPLTIDYNAMEIDMSCPFDCGCGADNCRGRVSGFANLPPAAQKEYLSAAAVPAASTAGEGPDGPPPLTGAVRAWAKENHVPGAH